MILDGTIKNNLAQMTINKGLFFNQDALFVCGNRSAFANIQHVACAVDRLLNNFMANGVHCESINEHEIEAIEIEI